MKSTLRHAATLMLVALLSLSYAVAQTAQSDLLGTWKMSSDSPNGALQWTLFVKDADDKLTAMIKTPDGGDATCKDVSYKDGVLRFVAPYQGTDYDVELKFADRKLEGTWTGSGDSGRCYGTKAP